MKGKIDLELSDLLIPQQGLELSFSDKFRSGCEFAPSEIKSLADATLIHYERGPHRSLPKLEDVDYGKVRSVSIYVQGYGGFGGSCPILSKKDFERLKESCLVTKNSEMIGEPVIVVYNNNRFVGFLGTHYYTEISREK